MTVWATFYFCWHFFRQPLPPRWRSTSTLFKQVLNLFATTLAKRNGFTLTSTKPVCCHFPLLFWQSRSVWNSASIAETRRECDIKCYTLCQRLVVSRRQRVVASSYRRCCELTNWSTWPTRRSTERSWEAQCNHLHRLNVTWDTTGWVIQLSKMKLKKQRRI